MKLSRRTMFSIGILDLALAALDLYALNNYRIFNPTERALGWTLVAVTGIVGFLLIGLAGLFKLRDLIFILAIATLGYGRR